jgi:hypothetical protein
MSMHLATRKKGQKKDARLSEEAAGKKTEWLESQETDALLLPDTIS